MGLDFSEGVEDVLAAKAFYDKVAAAVKSLKVPEGQPAKPISAYTEVIAELVKEAGKLAEKVQADVKD